MSDERELIDWKTGFWKDPRVVDVYHRLMQREAGTTPLKNEVEQDLVRRHVLPGSVLDVGCGTGRASLPLARAGMTVTGIDSSQAMLDQFRRLAGELPLTLQVGDVAALDFADAAFDNLVALNVLVHFPHWREVLAEWRRVTRPGGRLVFDLYSQDHLDAVAEKLGVAPPAPTGADCRNFATGETAKADFMTYLNRVRAEELVAAADALGVTLLDVLPYGIVISGAGGNLWRMQTLSDRHAWERLLCWLPEDARLRDFARFLEEEGVARLPAIATDHFMVVLENTPDPARNQAWLARQRRLAATLEAGIAWPDLATQVPSWDAAWRDRLNAALDWPRNRVLFYFLWSAFWDHPRHLDLASFLDARHVDALTAWREQWQRDEATSAILRGFAADPEFAEMFEYQGVDLRPGLEYELTREILTDYFKAFE